MHSPVPDLDLHARPVPVESWEPRRPTPRIGNVHHAAQRQAVERVVRAIMDHPASDWQIEDMAKIAQFSKFHFTRIFVRYTGMPPHRWLLHYRVELAKALLLRTSHTVSDITKVLGYESIGTFSSRFSKTVGYSPTTYRRSQGELANPAELDPTELPGFDDTVGVLIAEMGTPGRRPSPWMLTR